MMKKLRSLTMTAVLALGPLSLFACAADEVLDTKTSALSEDCTLTQGYWKTHSLRGPAPYDDAWLLLGPLGSDTQFLNSSYTWYQLFWTPVGGNAWINLAHQYMAAYLNLLNGSMAPGPVDTAMANAEALFDAQGAGDTKLTPAEKKKAGKWMTTIGNYNEGVTGPGHCDE